MITGKNNVTTFQPILMFHDQNGFQGFITINLPTKNVKRNIFNYNVQIISDFQLLTLSEYLGFVEFLDLFVLGGILMRFHVWRWDFFVSFMSSQISYGFQTVFLKNLASLNVANVMKYFLWQKNSLANINMLWPNIFTAKQHPSSLDQPICFCRLFQ